MNAAANQDRFPKKNMNASTFMEAKPLHFPQPGIEIKEL